MNKNWMIKSKPPSGIKDRLLGIIKILLKNRGLTSKKAQQDFFRPPHPDNLSCKDLGIKKTEINKVIKRLNKAKKNKENIIIYGDYDADGITAAAIMWETLNDLGFKVLPFLPHRETEGYGIKPKGIKTLIQKLGKPQLLVTVDNGSVAFAGAKYCQKNNIDLIICDHHESKKTLPKACAIIHSTQTAGVGVAYFLAKEIKNYFNRDESKLYFHDRHLELAAIGVVADMVPLVDISRSLVMYGLKALASTKRPGLKALLLKSGLDLNQSLTAYHIGFIIGPRLNAVGRLDHSLDALRLLCTKDKAKANKLAKKLDQINQERQDKTTDSTIKIIEEISKTHQKKKIIITHSENYHPGVIGLIAGKLVERFYKPAIAIAKKGNYGKGSVRSIQGVNIIKLLRSLETEFEDLGGHPLAAGFTIASDKIEVIQKKLEVLAKEYINKDQLKPILDIDTEINFLDINLDLYNRVQQFAPFGIANPKPVFVSRGVIIQNFRVVGREQNHLKMYLCQKLEAGRWKPEDGHYSAEVIEAIYFNAEKWIDRLKSGDVVDVVYKIDLNQWNGNTNMQLVIKDMRLFKRIKK